MYFAKIWRCTNCRREMELEQDHVPGGPCDCGGAFVESGECYDDEFARESNANPDEDYRNDRW